MPSDDFAAPGTISAANQWAVFERFSRRLIGLARVHLDERFQHKVDPEDVVQSVYKSFLIRYGDGALAAEGWEGLWGLLTLWGPRSHVGFALMILGHVHQLSREWF